LREAIHAAFSSDVDASVFGGYLSELVFFDDFVGDICLIDPDEFGTV
jgi:hypothetical protein